MSTIRLDSITLRGVGSYFQGATLNIKPLTVLCGKNGSGKSTWLNAMRILERSHRKGLLPFQFCVDDGNIHNLELKNSRMANLNSLDFIEDPAALDAFGPLGTIGITCIATQDSCLFPGEDLTETRHPAATLLRAGRFVAGTSFRLRIAHVVSDFDEDYRQDFIELLVDGIHIIRMTRAPAARRQIDKADRTPYVLECSRGLFDDLSASNDEIVTLLRFQMPFKGGEPWGLEPIEPFPPSISMERLLHQCIRLIQSIYNEVINGFFYISAVRDIHETWSYEKIYSDPSPEELIAKLGSDPAETSGAPGETREELIQQLREAVSGPFRNELAVRRYVGSHGEASFELLRRFVTNRMNDSAIPAGYSFNDFVSGWLDSLLQIRSEFERYRLGNNNLPHMPEAPRCGFLQKTTPDELPDSDNVEYDPGDLTHFSYSCFGQSQGPPRFSSGFHQLTPIIVQAALLQRGEIMAIENPEVHLHPSLQLKASEFLMRQALGGKTIIVETHSDLILRRLIRAVLEEELPQELVGINFISLRSDDGRLSMSIMQPLRVGENGRIDNWPEGFLDDDIKESRRLFSIMYGTLPEKDNEDSK